MSNDLSWLNRLGDRVHKEISDYAERMGITYEEATKRAYVKVGGVELKPMSAEEICIDIPKGE